MIFDRLEHAFLYRGLKDGITTALEYLTRTDFSQVENGRYELDGDRVYAMVSRYQPKTLDNAIWESHRKYIDVQFVARGVGRIGYCPLHRAPEIQTQYDDARDMILYQPGTDFVHVSSGEFLVFFPHDVHAPSLQPDPAVRAAEEVLKVVVKVAVGR